MWRKARNVSGAGKWDPEYHEGICLGMSTAGVDYMVGTADGIQYTQDERRLPECQRFNQPRVRECISWVKESFENHVAPDTDEPIFEDVIPSSEPHIRDEGEVEEREVRRMRLYPRYFVKFRYTQD